MTAMPYYGPALARVHHEGFGGHGDTYAPGILSKLRPVRERGGVVLELGCGSGALTRHLVAAGHRVVATDASPAMLALARETVPGVEAFRRLTLPDNRSPAADAVVSAGHVLSYLPNALAVERAFRIVAAALRSGGVLAVDLLDRTYRVARPGRRPWQWSETNGRFSSRSTPRFRRPTPATSRRSCAVRPARRSTTTSVMSMSVSTRLMCCVCLPTRG